MDGPGEFGRRLKFLRERDQVTMTRLAAMTTIDKDRLKALEIGRVALTTWERQRIAEVFNVPPEYFSPGARPAEEGSAVDAQYGTVRISDEAALASDALDRSGSIEIRRGAPEGASPRGAQEQGAPGGTSMASEQEEPVSARRRGGKSVRQRRPVAAPPVADPSLIMGKALAKRFDRSQEVPDEVRSGAVSAEPHSRGFGATLRDAPLPPPRPTGSHSMVRGQARAAPLPPDMTVTSEVDALFDATFGVAPPLPPVRQAPAIPPGSYAPLSPEALARAAQVREAALTGAIDPKQAAFEALVYAKALTEVLLARGLLTGDELSKALRRARGE
jgi:transcriptional regulator with XRE-family HTH domain